MRRLVLKAIILGLFIGPQYALAAEGDQSAAKRDTQQRSGIILTSDYTWEDCVADQIDEYRDTQEEAYRKCDAAQSASR